LKAGSVGNAEATGLFGDNIRSLHFVALPAYMVNGKTERKCDMVFQDSMNLDADCNAPTMCASLSFPSPPATLCAAVGGKECPQNFDAHQNSGYL